MVRTMLAMIAPDHPAHIAVTKVAITLQHIALTIVLLCVSVNLLSYKKAPLKEQCLINLCVFKQHSA
jgi:hypothetical protein